jgi:hypothetical protein
MKRFLTSADPTESPPHIYISIALLHIDAPVKLHLYLPPPPRKASIPLYLTRPSDSVQPSRDTRWIGTPDSRTLPVPIISSSQDTRRIVSVNAMPRRPVNFKDLWVSGKLEKLEAEVVSSLKSSAVYSTLTSSLGEHGDIATAPVIVGLGNRSRAGNFGPA